jgi:hypothetical protein
VYRLYSIYKQAGDLFLNNLLTDMSVLTVSKETKDKIREKVNIDEERIKEAVQTLKEWLEAQPHLPHDYGKYCHNSLALFAFILVYPKAFSEKSKGRLACTGYGKFTEKSNGGKPPFNFQTTSEKKQGCSNKIKFNDGQRVYLEYLKERECLEDLDVRWKVTIKMDVKEIRQTVLHSSG